MSHPELPIISFTSVALVLLAVLLNGGIRTESNMATTALVSSFVVLNIVYGLDAVLWSNSARDLSPAWCNISTNILVGYGILVPATCVCIAVRVEYAFSKPGSSKLPWKIMQGVLCTALPAIYMVLHYIVQGPLYIIIEDIGCRPTVFPSVVTVFIFWYPAFMLSLIAIVCSVIALRHFYRQPNLSLDATRSDRPALDRDHSWRLLFACIFTALLSAVKAAVELALSLQINGSTKLPSFSWSSAHTGVLAFLANETPTSQRSLFLTAWWTIPGSTLIFSALLFDLNNAKETWAALSTRYSGRRSARSGPRPLLTLRRSSSFGGRRAFSLEKPGGVSVKPPVLALMDLCESDGGSATSTSSSSTLFDYTSPTGVSKPAKTYDAVGQQPPTRPATKTITVKPPTPKRTPVRPPVLVNLDLLNLPNFADTDGAYAQLSANVDRRPPAASIPASVASSPSRYSQLSAFQQSSVKTFDIPLDSVSEIHADTSFASATLDYLRSPTGRAVLGELPSSEGQVSATSTRPKRDSGPRAFGAKWPRPPSSIPSPTGSPAPSTPTSLRSPQSPMRKPAPPTSPASPSPPPRSNSLSSVKNKLKNERRHATITQTEEEPKSFLPL